MKSSDELVIQRYIGEMVDLEQLLLQISTRVDPDDVFTYEQLESWALAHNFIPFGDCAE